MSVIEGEVIDIVTKKKNGKEYDQYPPNLKSNIAVQKFKKDFRNTKIV